VSVVLRAMLYVRPHERHHWQAQPQGENVDTACTRALKEHSEEVLFDINIVTKTRHLDGEMRSSTRENGKVAVERPGVLRDCKRSTPLLLAVQGFDIPRARD